MAKFTKLLLPFFTVFLTLGCSTQSKQVSEDSEPSFDCNFSSGFERGKTQKIYKNSCSPQTEESFLTGFRIGRKLSWVGSKIESYNHEIQCLKKESTLKFNGTLSPVVIDLSGPESDLHKRLAQDKCDFATVRTSTEMRDAITDAEKERDQLKKKMKRILELTEKIKAEPTKSSALIEEYQDTGPIDELDINLRWKDFIAQSGGLQKLDKSTRYLIYEEIPEKPKLSSKEIYGSLFGFGIGQYHQGRFKSSGWQYALLDSILVGLLLTKSSNNLNTVLATVGLPMSRGFQFLDVFTYNEENNFDLDSLRTRFGNDLPVFAWNISW